MKPRLPVGATTLATLWAPALLVLTLLLVPHTAVADSWSDDFDDGDYTNDPAWTERNFDDAPGTLEIAGSDDYLRIYRDVSGGNGGTTGVEIELSLYVSERTSVSFDVNPVHSNVVGGAGYHDSEYPIEVHLYLLDTSMNPLELLFCYNYRGGASLYEDDYVRVAFPDCEENEWLRQQSFRIREYFPQAAFVERIMLAQEDGIVVYDVPAV